MNKKIVSIIILGVIIIFAFVGFKTPIVRDGVAAILPLSIKQKIKDTLFIVPSLREELVVKETELNDLSVKLKIARRTVKNLKQQNNSVSLSKNQALAWQTLSKVYAQTVNELLLHRSETPSIVSSTNKEFHLYRYELPFLPTRLSFGLKPLFYLDSTSTDFYAVTGDGVFFKGSRADIGKETIGISTIPSNIRQIIKDKAFYKPGWFSIKDLKIHKGKAYINYTKKIGDGYTLVILVADLSSQNLEFKEFFTVSDPVSTGGQFNAHQTGGRLVAYKNNKLLMSTGEFRKWVKPQDKNSLLGKIFSIDIDTKQTELLSMGHRNPQGLHYDPITGVIVSTEHGPAGGDEVNLNNSFGSKIVNFGWPISSYGKHYDGRKHEEAPLKKSHEKHGFTEPLMHFVPSIGISQLVKLPLTFDASFSNDYFAASMGMNPKGEIYSIHHFRLDNKNQNIVANSIIHIGDRIRDIHVFDDKQLLLALEGDNIPAIAILSAK